MHTKQQSYHAVRPKTSLTVAEQSLVTEYYERNEVILEYGSGASTVLASQLGQKEVFSVESDVNWARNMELWFQENPTTANVHIHHVDIGPTIAWGIPKNRAKSGDWYKYPLSVWERKDFRQPGVVLIDGRFRPACFLVSLLMTDGELDILFDDYKPRPEYSLVEEFAQLVEMRGRMARFRVCKVPPTRKLVRTLISLIGDSW